jgi:competence protein ComGC
MSGISSGDMKKIFKLLFVLLVILIVGFFVHLYLIPDIPITTTGPEIAQTTPLVFSPFLLTILTAVTILLVFFIPKILTNRDEKKRRHAAMQQVLLDWDRRFR